MPAVESVLQLYTLKEKDGTITAFDSYGSDVHVGTSAGLLLRLSVTEARSAASTERARGTHDGAASTEVSHVASRGEHNITNDLSPQAKVNFEPNASSAAEAEVSMSTTVARRCTLSSSGAAVQQLQHSRSQRVVFVLCEGRLLLLHAETYAVLGTIATNIVSFSVAQPVHRSRPNGEPSTASVSAASSGYYSNPRVYANWFTGMPEDDEGAAPLHSRTISHTRTSSEASYGSSPAWTPRSTVVNPVSPTTPGLPSSAVTHRRSGLDKAHVVCVAERNKKELAVYLVDRVSTRVGSGSNRTAPTPSPLPASLSPSTADAGSDAAPPPVRVSLPTSASAPRVVLRQRFVLPEPAQCVVMCAPTPLVARPPDTLDVSASSGNNSGAATVAVEAGLTVCVGMRREVSLLPLLSGAPRCVLRLDGSRPPLLAVGSDHNTYLVRTQAPNTVMEVGVPRATASAGLVAKGSAVAALTNPIEVRMGYHRMSAAGTSDDDRHGAAALPAAVQLGREDELIMGDVFQTTAAVDLVVARFPYVFLFSATHCDVVSLLGDGGSGGGAHPGATVDASTHQRVPLPGVRHGALRGQGKSLFVASERAVWSLQLFPLRVQLAEMVRGGRSEEAFQLLAFHQQRATALGLVKETHPLASLERDLHRMAGFASLYKGDVDAALRLLRGHVDPREILLLLPDCIPPHALACKPRDSPAAPPPSCTSAPSTTTSTTLTTAKPYVVRSMDAAVSTSKVRQFLRESSDKATPDSDDEAMASASYWERWAGPCVYNSGVSDVSAAWRATHAAMRNAAAATAGSARDPSSADAAAFVARSYDALKTGVRRWFTEEVFEAAQRATAAASPLPQPLRDATVLRDSGDATPTQWRDKDGGDVNPPADAATPFSSSAVHMRPMAYAALVLAWQARDFRTAYHIVSTAHVCGLTVEDCAALLTYLREYRLLALLYFQLGRGELCVDVLRRRVCLSNALRRRAEKTAADADELEGVQASLACWRQRMRERFCNEDEGHHERVSFLTLLRQGPVCGLGLWMQPSLSRVARVAQLLFNVHAGEDEEVVPSTALHSTTTLMPQQLQQRQLSSESLLDSIFAFYAAQTCPTSSSTASTAEPSFSRIYFSARDDMSAKSFSLPHAGPVFAAAAATDGAHVLPSPLSEYLYAVEKLDVVTVRQVLHRHPRLAQLRDLDGATGLHLVLAQLRVAQAATANNNFASSQSPHEHERAAASLAAFLDVVCALVGLLVHFGCPVAALTCGGWSCLDVAAVACGGDATTFDIVSAAVLAAVELSRGERQIC